VYIAMPSNLGSFAFSPQEIAAAVDVAIARWRAAVPIAFADLTRVGDPVSYVAAVPPTLPRCGVEDREWVSEAQAAVGLGGSAANGIADHLIVMFPTDCLGGDVAGNGDLASNSWSDGSIAIAGGSPDYPGGPQMLQDHLATIVEHELGHTFGFGHANRVCGEGCPLAPAPVVNYGDCYSVMGQAGGGVVSTAHRVMDGVIEPGELVGVDGDAGAVDTVVTVQPRGATAGLRGLAVTDSETGQTWYFDYRAAVGLDSRNICPSGVTVTTVVGRSTLLIPRAQQGPTDTASFMWPSGSVIALSPNVSVTVGSLDPSAGAQLQVRHAALPPFGKVPRARLGGNLFRNGLAKVDFRNWKSRGVHRAYRWYLDGELLRDNFGVPLSQPNFHLTWAEGRLGAVVTLYSAGHRRAVVQVPAKRLLDRSQLPKVRLTGTARVGETVTAHVRKPKSVKGGWRLHYQWRVGRVRIRVDAPSLLLSPHMVGEQIRVIVTAHWHGYELPASSRPTKPVKR
jgi:hypothetical protein